MRMRLTQGASKGRIVDATPCDDHEIPTYEFEMDGFTFIVPANWVEPAGGLDAGVPENAKPSPSNPLKKRQMNSLRERINEKCKDCIYDPYGKGTWVAQVAQCTSASCPLFDVRPLQFGKVAGVEPGKPKADAKE